jgi:hypothetical protein
MPGHVLTPKEMEEVWIDIKNIITPSWMTSVPANLGSSNHGKPKADQWRVLGTTYLPVSLICLWAKLMQSNDMDRHEDILNVTLSLLSAVIIASSRVTSRTHAASFHQYMTAYVEGLQCLFPNYKLHSIHHMALHLHEYLLQYGPVHAWWTFPFERLIGILQRIPTNNKLDESHAIICRLKVTQS